MVVSTPSHRRAEGRCEVVGVFAFTSHAFGTYQDALADQLSASVRDHKPAELHVKGYGNPFLLCFSN
jgi:hypothetical protein